jgi:hypothetical protein
MQINLEKYLDTLLSNKSFTFLHEAILYNQSIRQMIEQGMLINIPKEITYDDNYIHCQDNIKRYLKESDWNLLYKKLITKKGHDSSIDIDEENIVIKTSLKNVAIILCQKPPKVLTGFTFNIKDVEVFIYHSLQNVLLKYLRKNYSKEKNNNGTTTNIKISSLKVNKEIIPVNTLEKANTTGIDFISVRYALSTTGGQHFVSILPYYNIDEIATETVNNDFNMENKLKSILDKVKQNTKKEEGPI